MRRSSLVLGLILSAAYRIGTAHAMLSNTPDSLPYVVDGTVIAVAAFYGFVSGDDGTNTFRPDSPINRAEVAKIIALARKVAGESH